jgi:hypothetical protein
MLRGSGLGTVTHFYGIFEALNDSHDVQPWPPGCRVYVLHPGGGGAAR